MRFCSDVLYYVISDVWIGGCVRRALTALRHATLPVALSTYTLFNLAQYLYSLFITITPLYFIVFSCMNAPNSSNYTKFVHSEFIAYELYNILWSN